MGGNVDPSAEDSNKELKEDLKLSLKVKDMRDSISLYSPENLRRGCIVLQEIEYS